MPSAPVTRLALPLFTLEILFSITLLLHPYSPPLYNPYIPLRSESQLHYLFAPKSSITFLVYIRGGGH